MSLFPRCFVVPAVSCALSVVFFLLFFLNPQHPCVHDEVTGVSLLGLPALQALLYHCRYFQHVALCASSCYQGRRVFHSQPCADAGGGGLFPPENTLLGRSGVKPITRCQQGSPSEISSCPPPIRFRGLSVVLEERPAGVRRQPQEAFQLALHVQHDGQRTPHLHTFNTVQHTQNQTMSCLLKRLLHCGHSRVEVRCSTPRKVRHR